MIDEFSIQSVRSCNKSVLLAGNPILNDAYEKVKDLIWNEAINDSYCLEVDLSELSEDNLENIKKILKIDGFKVSHVLKPNFVNEFGQLRKIPYQLVISWEV